MIPSTWYPWYLLTIYTALKTYYGGVYSPLHSLVHTCDNLVTTMTRLPLFTPLYLKQRFDVVPVQLLTFLYPPPRCPPLTRLATCRFYVTAENRGTCRALWCRLPGAGRRRVSSLLNLSPVVQQVAVKSSKTTSKPNAIPTRASNKEAAVATAAAVTSDILSVFVHPSTTEGGADEHDRRSRGAQLPTKAAAELKTEVGVAAKRAIALSVALTEEDDAISAGIRGGAKSLFTSRAPRAPGDGERRASGCEGTDNEGEEGEEEGDAPINIAVVSRCRPLLAREIKRGVRAAVFCEGNEVVVSGKDLPIDRSRRFEFDRVFGKIQVTTM